jgi:nicotinamidase-related amidase
MANDLAARHLEPVTPHNAVLLLVDQQQGLFSRIYQPEKTLGNLVALLRCCILLEIPVVMTTALADSPNGAQLQELTKAVPHQPIIDRTLINAWQDARVREAISRTGRRKAIMAGTGLDVCAQLSALGCIADGYEPFVVLDAWGRFEQQPSVATISRLTQAGVVLVNTRVVVLEAMADNAHPMARDIYAALPAGIVVTEGASTE